MSPLSLWWIRTVTGKGFVLPECGGLFALPTGCWDSNTYLHAWQCDKPRQHGSRVFLNCHSALSCLNRESAVNLVRSGSYTRQPWRDEPKGNEALQTGAPSTYVSTYLKRYSLLTFKINCLLSKTEVLNLPAMLLSGYFLSNCCIRVAGRSVLIAFPHPAANIQVCLAF